MDGHQLEKIFKQGLLGKVQIIDTEHTDKDLYERTDLIVQHRAGTYRVDPTWDFRYKETHGITQAIGRIEQFENKGLIIHAQYGYRTHNGIRFLPEPTLVVGIKDYSKNLEREELWAIDAFKELSKHILDRGIELYNEHELIPKIQKDPFYIENIKNYKQTRAMHIAAIEACPAKDIENLAWLLADADTETQQLAVRKNGLAIIAFSNPSQYTQLYAVEQNLDAYECIDNPTEKVTQRYQELQQEKEQQEKNKKIEKLNEELEQIKNKMFHMNPSGKEAMHEYVQLASQRKDIQAKLQELTGQEKGIEP